MKKRSIPKFTTSPNFSDYQVILVFGLKKQIVWIIKLQRITRLSSSPMLITVDNTFLT